MERVTKIELWFRVIVFSVTTYFGAVYEPHAPDRDSLICWISITLVSLIALGINAGEIIYRFIHKIK